MHSWLLPWFLPLPAPGSARPALAPLSPAITWRLPSCLSLRDPRRAWRSGDGGRADAATSRPPLCSCAQPLSSSPTWHPIKTLPDFWAGEGHDHWAWERMTFPQERLPSEHRSCSLGTAVQMNAASNHLPTVLGWCPRPSPPGDQTATSFPGPQPAWKTNPKIHP